MNLIVQILVLYHVMQNIYVSRSPANGVAAFIPGISNWTNALDTSYK